MVVSELRDRANWRRSHEAMRVYGEKVSAGEAKDHLDAEKPLHRIRDVAMTEPFIIDSGPSRRGWHYYANFLRCSMLFYWKEIYPKAHNLGWNDYTPPLARGSLVHIGLAHYYAQMWARQNGKDPNKIVDCWQAMKIAAERIGEFGAEKLPVATSMLNAYFRRYPTETFKVVAVEYAVEMMFGEALYTARLDLVVEEPDGMIYAYDTKTAARLDSKTQRRYTIHGQFFGQRYLGRHTYGDRFADVVVNMISEDGECIRKRPDPAPFMFRAFPKIVEGANQAIEASKERFGDDPDQWATAANPDEQTCFGPYGQCPAFELCRWGGGSR